MMANEKNWFIACIRPRTEKKVTELLDRKQIVYYYPDLLSHSGLRTSKDDIFKQFNCIVFLHLSNSELHLVQSIDSVTGLMFWLNKPATMMDEEIAAIKQFILANKKISVEKTDVHANENEFLFYNAVADGANPQIYKLNLTSIGFSLLAYQQQELPGIMKSVA